MTVFRSIITLALVLALSLITLAPAAWAGDLCIDGAAGNPASLDYPIIIGRSFRIPRKNKCKPFNGVLVGFPGAVMGTACTSYDGDHTTFTLLAIAGSSGFFGNPEDRRTYALKLTIATLDGYMVSSLTSSSAAPNTVFAHAYECKKIYPDNL